MWGAPERYALLNGLGSPADLRRLAAGRLPALARELRTLLLTDAAPHNGHLAAGLASTELAIAVHYVFDTPHDLLVWDGGHAACPHRVLTDWRARGGGWQPGACGIGHTGNAISVALGMAAAAARRGEQRRVVAIIGERALSAGMAYEALNHAGSLPIDLLVILNDNGPPISGLHAGLSNLLARLLSGRVYSGLRERGKQVLRHKSTMWELARRSEEHLKGMVLPGTLLEELEFNYVGPVDGHNLKALVATLGNLKRLHGPQFLHVVTRAGRSSTSAVGGSLRWRRAGRPVRAAPDTPQGAGGGGSYSRACAHWLCDMAASDARIVAVATGMGEEPGLREFAQRFPDRCFDVGAAHQHAVTLAAGFATEGLRPVVAIPAALLQRTYDQLIHDVALQKLPVIFAVGGAGLVGGDGATHQGGYDLAYLRCIPNLTIMTPADENECRQMLYTASTLPGPAVVRYPRGDGPGATITAHLSALPLGRAYLCRSGASGVALLVFGAPLAAAADAATRLDATLVNMRFVKPLDREVLAVVATSHQALVTIEENVVAGGAGSAVAEALAASGLRIPLLQLGIPERFIERGSRASSLVAAGLDAPHLTARVERWWQRLGAAPRRASGG
jgi:1-deoxy-D-xylulose-5-phosphate synthase